MRWRIVVANLCRGCLWFFAGLLFWAVAPIALGWHPTTVMSDSMAPSIRAGSVVVVMPISSEALKPGQVVQVDDPDRPGRLRLHRLVSDTPSGTLTTRGDANQNDDSSTVPATALHGVGVLLVPLAGIPVTSIADGDIALELASFALIGLLAFGTRLDRRYLRGEATATVSAAPTDSPPLHRNEKE